MKMRTKSGQPEKADKKADKALFRKHDKNTLKSLIFYSVFLKIIQNLFFCPFVRIVRLFFESSGSEKKKKIFFSFFGVKSHSLFNCFNIIFKRVLR